MLYNIKVMNIYKTITETIDGVENKFIVIHINEYNNFMLKNNIYKKNKNEEEEKRKEERNNEIERKKIEAIIQKQKREEDKEKERINKIDYQIKINKINNEKIRKEKEELKEQYKEVFEEFPQSKIKKCEFCKCFKIFPYHFKDENNKSFIRPYTKDKNQEKAVCCSDCYEEFLIKKEDKKLKYTHNCEICNKKFIAYTDELYVVHLKSAEHKRNEAKLKGNINLSLLNIRQLYKICSKTVDERGLYRINNYTKIKKEELIKKMNDLYEFLIFE